jgi:hypothetical protein
MVRTIVVAEQLTSLAEVLLEPSEEPASRTIVGFVALLGGGGELVDEYEKVLVVLEGTDHAAAPDAEGYFQFTDLEPGIHRLSARAEGYRAPRAIEVDLTVESLHEATLFLESSALDRPGQGVITGSVELEDDGDVRGVTVGVAGTSMTALTDGSGRFTIDRVPVGTVVLIAQSPGYEVLELDGVSVAADETTDVGTLRLVHGRETPRVIAMDPPDGTSGVLVEPEIPIFVRFSEPMDIASVREALGLEPRVPHVALMGREHPETDHDLMLILVPGGQTGVDFNERVRVTIGTGAQSVEGVAMAQPYRGELRMGEPSLYSSSPRDGERAHPFDTPITLRFNAPLRAEEIDTAFSFSPTPPTEPLYQFETDPETGWTTVRIQVRLAPDREYTLRIGRKLRTVSGHRMGGRREIRFRSAPDIVIDHRGMPVPRDDSVVY